MYIVTGREFVQDLTPVPDVVRQEGLKPAFICRTILSQQLLHRRKRRRLPTKPTGYVSIVAHTTAAMFSTVQNAEEAGQSRRRITECFTNLRAVCLEKITSWRKWKWQYN